jgi:hypothetical protein
LKYIICGYEIRIIKPIKIVNKKVKEGDRESKTERVNTTKVHYMHYMHVKYHNGIPLYN